ncbi:formyltransferase family protein [Psychromonas aquimarina]|uniref:formyltransferase family protein n=1 Tax=Psychromonas aquimarina TaxID=444919 RepID=UPI0003FD96D2|nr:formyltransferase family protein [Psychromonas aquimarina]
MDNALLIKLAAKKCLFLCTAFNGLSQKFWVNFSPLFKESRLMVGIDPAAVQVFQPDLIICPFLDNYIPEQIWSSTPCFIVHPGPPDEAGPSALNWAILEGRTNWSVCIIQANEQWDAGPVWAQAEFKLPTASLSSIYRQQISDLAVQILPLALTHYYCAQQPLLTPPPRYRKRISQQQLSIEWDQPTAAIIKKIHAGDSQPGAPAVIENNHYLVYGARSGESVYCLKDIQPGEIIRHRDGQICVSTLDGCLWISRMARLTENIKIRPQELLAQSEITF